MNLKEVLPDLNLDPASLIMLASLGVAAAFFGLFLAIRSMTQGWRGRQSPADSPDSTPGLDLPTPAHEKSWHRRCDERFAQMTEATGLGLSPLEWTGAMLVISLGLAAGLYLWRGELNFALGGFVAGLAVPIFGLWLARRRVLTQIQKQLPDAFFFLARSLRAGLSFEQAMTLAATEGPQPLASELRRCADHLKLGLSPLAALQSAASRLQLPDFHVFVSVIALYTTTGGNLAQLLDKLAATTRDRNQYLGYFRSATALSRITAIAIGAAPPLLFLGYVFFEPDYAQRFFASSTGLVLLATAFGLESIGVVWLYLLLKVEY